MKQSNEANRLFQCLSSNFVAEGDANLLISIKKQTAAQSALRKLAIRRHGDGFDRALSTGC
jgi:hypothetical protein